MSRFLIILLLLYVCIPAIAIAQSPTTPLLRVHLDTKVAVPGQVILLEMTILVPTWMPKPPELPTFELPEVRVSLPEGSSRPALETIDGETWSGVTREYQVSPMTVGKFRLSPQTVVITYADPETLAPTVVRLRTSEILFEGRAPQGAEDLDPFIAASELTLEQSVDGDPADLEPGGAFTRIVTARIEGASPMFLPPLIESFDAAGIAAYPKEPSFAEGSNRGCVTGERVESVTYVAEAGGRYRAEPIELRWWNLRTKEIEISEVPGLDIVSRGPPPATFSVEDPIELAPRLVMGGVLLVLCLIVGGWAWPRLTEHTGRRRRERVASEAFAFENIIYALKHENFGDAVCSLEVWAARRPDLSDEDRVRLLETLAPLGAELYGREPRAPGNKEWTDAVRALRDLRRSFSADQERSQGGRPLPSLNPIRTAAIRFR